MVDEKSCVLLAERHLVLRDGVRGLLETTFETVFMVNDEASLLAGARRLRPAVVVIDVSLAEGDLPGLLGRVAKQAPHSKVLVVSVHDEPRVAAAALAAGAHAVVLTRSLGSDLLPAVDALLAGDRYVSPGIPEGPLGHEQGEQRKL